MQHVRYFQLEKVYCRSLHGLKLFVVRVIIVNVLSFRVAARPFAVCVGFISVNKRNEKR
jgi:hypothetical protein